MQPSLWKGTAAGLIGGLVGTWVKSQAEPALQTLGEAWFPPASAEKAQRGADPSDHPERMPPSELAQDATDTHLDQDEKTTAQERIHWTFGTLCGGAYGALAEVAPVDRGYGLPASAALFAGTHLTTVPALGLQADVDDLPEAWWVWEFGSHLAYGLATDLARRSVRALLG